MAKQSPLARYAQDAGVARDGLLARLEGEGPELLAGGGSSKKPLRLAKAFGPHEGFRPRKKNAAGGMRRASPGKKSEAAALLERHGGMQGNRDELLLELYYGNLSVAGAEEVARLMWGGETGLALIGEEARKIVRRLDLWLRRELLVPHRAVFVHSVRVKQRIGGKAKPSDLFVAVGTAADGPGEVLAVSVSNGPEDKPWNGLIAGLKERGLRGTVLFAGPNEPAAWEAVARHFPEAKYQGDLAQLQRDALWMVPVPAVDALLKAFAGIRASDTLSAANTRAARLVEELRGAGEFSAALFLERMFPIQFSHYHGSSAHRMKLHEGNPLQRPLHEWQSWIRKGGPVPDERTLVLMAAARLCRIFGPSGA